MVRWRSVVSSLTTRTATSAHLSVARSSTYNPPPALFEIGCVGRIVGSELLDDGRYNIVLEGVSRFRILREVAVDFGGEAKQLMVQRAKGRTTVPQIFIKGHHVGGCDDLVALDRAGKLDDLIGKS